MKFKHALCVMACCLSINGALAATSSTNTPPDKTALEAAIKSCAASAAKDANGQPDMKAMDTCMSGKGYTKPGGPPPGQGGNGQGNPPPPPK